MGRKSLFLLAIIITLLLIGCTDDSLSRESEEIQSNEELITEEPKPEPKKVDIIKKKLTIETKEESIDNGTAVNYYLKALDESGDIQWEKSWTDLQLTELPVASPHTIAHENVYVEVYGNLYVFNLYTGEKLWDEVYVGFSAHAPVVDELKTIYCTGFYNPFITVINPNGNIKWQHEYTDKYWPFKLTLEDGLIVVEYDGSDNGEEGGVIKYDKDGNIVKGNNSKKGSDNMEFSMADLKVEASSYLTENLSSGEYSHKPEYVLDDNLDTAWVEGVKGSGVNEWILLKFDNEIPLEMIYIINGYAKSQSLYKKNNRVKEIRVEFSDGSYSDLTLDDDTMDYQIFNFKESINTSYIKFTMLDVYKGSKYDDTCISEIIVE